MSDDEDLTGLGEDWMPGVEPAPYLDPDDLGIDPADDALPVVDLDALPDTSPSELDGQDDMDDSDLEGLGADGGLIWRRAVPRAREKVRTGASNQIGYCLREIRTINETPAKYERAVDSLIAADVKHRVADWSQVPRGSIGYYRGPDVTHPNGHVFENLGNGWVATTDSPLGHWGRVRGGDLMTRWGYEAAYWSPFVNDNRVWRPKRVLADPRPTPAEARVRRLERWRDELERRHRQRRHVGDLHRASVLEARIKIVTRLIKAARERG